MTKWREGDPPARIDFCSVITGEESAARGYHKMGWERSNEKTQLAIAFAILPDSEP